MYAVSQQPVVVEICVGENYEFNKLCKVKSILSICYS